MYYVVIGFDIEVQPLVTHNAFQPRNWMKPATLTFAWNPPMVILVSAIEICSGLFNKHQL